MEVSCETVRRDPYAMERLCEIVYICGMAVQKRSEPDWDDLRHFLALARHGGVSLPIPRPRCRGCGRWPIIS